MATIQLDKDTSLDLMDGEVVILRPQGFTQQRL